MITLIRKSSIYLRRLFHVCFVFCRHFRFAVFLANIISCKINKKFSVSAGLAFLQLEPINLCNLSCVLCSAGNGGITRPRGQMDFSFFKKLIDENERTLAFLVLYHMGEPFLHNDIFRMIDYAAKKNIFVKISSNGFFGHKDIPEKIIRSELDELLVSLDFPDAQSYKIMKGKDVFHEVVGNIKALIAARGSRLKPFISLQLLMTRNNQDRVKDFFSLSRDLGVDQALIKKIRVDNPDSRNEFLPFDKRYIRRLYRDGRNSAQNSCLRPQVSATVLWDGNVTACCFDMDGKFIFGNLHDFSLRKIHSDFLNHRDDISSLCKRCSINDDSGIFIKNKDSLKKVI